MLRTRKTQTLLKIDALIPVLYLNTGRSFTQNHSETHKVKYNPVKIQIMFQLRLIHCNSCIIQFLQFIIQNTPTEFSKQEQKLRYLFILFLVKQWLSQWCIVGEKHFIHPEREISPQNRARCKNHVHAFQGPCLDSNIKNLCFVFLILKCGV